MHGLKECMCAKGDALWLACWWWLYSVELFSGPNMLALERTKLAKHVRLWTRQTCKNGAV